MCHCQYNTALAGVDQLVVGELSAVGGLIGHYSASRVMPTRDAVIGRGNTCATCAEPEVDGVPLFSAYLYVVLFVLL